MDLSAPLVISYLVSQEDKSKSVDDKCASVKQPLICVILVRRDAIQSLKHFWAGGFVYLLL